ncbi:YdcF family protein [Anaeromicropila populeti]|uniref:Uncharacterized SAM-binding protein YcdF, DUF218 family n=1 Tax=Anaeromicropila populeti TaxID=37658 RepID=A0A1I6JY43_9FIRM|nr:YdcF family protein [Anaeromicropila populeti]SFR83876.1 Uncharacterized SAM-binding protein YcdF, DUF218 family [Anaeromicropila populeti]
MNKRRCFKNLNIISFLFGLLGIISFFYFIIIISYAGIKADFALFWVLLGSMCFVVMGILMVLKKEQVMVPKPLLYGAELFILAGLALFLFIEAVIISSARSKPSENADYMIVLGAQVKGKRVSKALKYRLDTAIEYLEKNELTKVIVSGGQGEGEDISEAEAMFRYLVQNGISPERIIKEDKSKNTYENITFSKVFIEPEKTTIIVTNSFHVYRGMALAKKQNFGTIEGLNAPTDKILCIHYYVREAVAVVKDKLVRNI